MQGQYKRVRRRRRWTGVRVQDVDPVRQKATEIEIGTPNGSLIQPYDMSFPQSRSQGCQDGDLVPQLDQTSGQPDHNPLGAAIPSYRHRRVGIQSYPHAAAMYRAAAGVAKQRIG
jgi:hypothetical protein